MSQSIRTTITLPEELARAIDQTVKEGKAKSRNELIARAIRRELADLERAEIDAAFADMMHDQQYLEESLAISREFAVSDWEALKKGESQG